MTPPLSTPARPGVNGSGPIPGRLNGSPRSRVQSLQRARILAAAVDTVDEVGYARMTVAQIVGRARVSRKTFYEVFTDRAECFLAAFEYALAQAIPAATEAYAREDTWRDGVRSALALLLEAMDDHPRLARLVVVDSLAAGPKLLQRRVELLAQFAKIVDEGRSVSDTASQPPNLTAEGVVGAISMVLYKRLLDRSEEPMTELLAPMMSMIVLPYLGAEAASQELALPPPATRREPRSNRPPGGEDLLKGLEIRLTYRTVRVLSAVAEHPGASSREVRKRTGVPDEGQMSKLMARLAGLNLVENVSDDTKAGAPKAWRLTERGNQLERAAGRSHAGT